jgi:hypothetical protein
MKAGPWCKGDDLKAIGLYEVFAINDLRAHTLKHVVSPGFSRFRLLSLPLRRKAATSWPGFTLIRIHRKQ